MSKQNKTNPKELKLEQTSRFLPTGGCIALGQMTIIACPLLLRQGLAMQSRWLKAHCVGHGGH